MNTPSVSCVLLAVCIQSGVVEAAEPAIAPQPTEPAPAADATASASSAPSGTATRAAERSASGGRVARAIGLNGAVGLLRVASADSGSVGTFGLGLSESLYFGSGFLCPDCTRADGSVSTNSDESSVSVTRLQLSLTPLKYFETFAGMNFQAVSNDQSEPRVHQTGGNANLGGKLFTPYKMDRPWSVGALADVSVAARSQSVGGATVNLDMAALGTLDLRELTRARQLPLRIHVSGGYRFDNTWKTAADIEARRAESSGSFSRVTRIERLGFGLRRTDILRLGLGVEGTFAPVRPFAEWSIDIPINRQGHVCRIGVLSAGDDCLSRAGSFGSIPSRVTAGLRAYPFKRASLEGLGLLAAVDIGTGGTSKFLEEAIPELPWMAHLGLAYAFDPAPRIVRVVETIAAKAQPRPALLPQLVIVGTVVEKSAIPGSELPVADALVRFKDSAQTGLISDIDGRFKTAPLLAGNYAFHITKDGFAESDCETLVRAKEAGEGEKAGANGGDTAQPREDITEVTCALVRLPTVAAVTGVLRDADTTLFVPRAGVSLYDARGRRLALTTDEFGGFSFQNVPAGAVRLEVVSDGYLTQATEIDLHARENASVQLSLHKRPKQSHVTVTAKELKLNQQIHFLHDSVEILPDSQAVIEEIADALRSHPDILGLEIQGHTDDLGNAEHNLTLSESRAKSVMNALIVLGVEKARLSARGFGAKSPLVPNTNAASRSKNRRVQFMIR